jgi:hypothetical protein
MAFVLPPPDDSKKRWTQEESVNFESARETITALMAIHTRQAYEESKKQRPDPGRLAALEIELSRLAEERSSLRVADHANVTRIRTEYGATVRSWRKKKLGDSIVKYGT